MFGFHRWTVSIRSSRQPCTLRLASVSTARPPSCCQRSIQSSESNMQIVSAKGARSGTSLLLPGVALWCPHIGGVARLLAVLLLGTTWLAIARMDVCARACVCVRMRAYACVPLCARLCVPLCAWLCGVWFAVPCRLNNTRDIPVYSKPHMIT